MKQILLVVSFVLFMGQVANGQVFFDVRDTPNDCGGFIRFSFLVLSPLPQKYVVYSAFEENLPWDREFEIVFYKKTGQETIHEYYTGDGQIEYYVDQRPNNFEYESFHYKSEHWSYKYYYLCDEDNRCWRPLSKQKVVALANIRPAPINIGECRVDVYSWKLICPPSPSAKDCIVNTFSTKYYERKVKKTSISFPHSYDLKIGKTPSDLKVRETVLAINLSPINNDENPKFFLNSGDQGLSYIQVVTSGGSHKENGYWIRDQESASKIGIVNINYFSWEWSLSILGDFNNDRIVDFQDFLILIELYGTSDAKADFDQDGTVEFSDFLLFTENFN